MSANEPMQSRANLPQIGSKFRCTGHCRCPNNDPDQLNQDGSCPMCGETRSISIVHELKSTYEDRMRSLSAHPGGDADQVRLYEQWVTDLQEQNVLLLEAVENLEKASCHRVTLLEAQLNESSVYADNFMKSSKHLRDGIECSDAERSCLDERIGHLESDVRSLCTLIRQVRLHNNWATDGINFFEVTAEDIFGGSSCQTGHQDTVMLLAHKDEQIRDLVKTIQTLEDDNQAQASAPPENVQADDTLVGQLEADLRMAEVTRTAQYTDILELSRQLKDSAIRMDYEQHEKERVACELASVHRELHFKAREVDALNQAIVNIEKSSKDMQAALTAEVADKHDLVSQLRRECQQLEERCHQADTQINFKDGIIKEMRKTIKFNRCKIAELEDGLIVKNVETDRSIVQSKSVAFVKANASISTLKEQPVITEKQSKSRPKVSKFFQPDTGDYIVSSGHPYGDSNEVKPSLSSVPVTSKRFTSEIRFNSPPCKDVAVRDEVTSLADEEINGLRLKLKAKEEQIAKLQAKITATKCSGATSKQCILKITENSAVDEDRIKVDQLIGKLCKCNGDEDLVGLKRIFANLQTSLSLVNRELTEARDMYLNNGSSVHPCDALDSYSARFQNEEVATDEMKEDMNKLVADLKAKNQQVIDQELIIEKLRSELQASKQSKSNKKLLLKCSPCVTFKESETTYCPATRSKKTDFDYSGPSKEYQALDQSVSAVTAMTETLEKKDECIALQAEIIALMQAMLRQTEELQEENGFHRSCEMKQSYLNQQNKIEELMKSLAEYEYNGTRYKKNVKSEKRPPKILRARSVEEFRVKTVESQAAVEDLDEEIEALLNHLYCRENKLNELEKLICTLQQSLSVYSELIRKLQESGKKCLRKQTTDIEFSKRTERIEQLQRDFDNSLRIATKIFDKMRTNKEHSHVVEYQASANECQRLMSSFAAEVHSAVNGLALCRDQQELCIDAMGSEQQPLEQVECTVAKVQAEVKNYFQFKKESEKCREEIQRKIEKFKTELDNAQEELRRNVENYKHIDYTVPGTDFSCHCTSVDPKRTSHSCENLSDYVSPNHGPDASMRSTIDRMKLEIKLLTEKLDEHERHNAVNEQSVDLLRDEVRTIEGAQDAIDPGVNSLLQQKEETPTPSDDTAVLKKALDITQIENAKLRAALEQSQGTPSVEVFEDDKKKLYNNKRPIPAHKYSGPKNLVLFEPSTSSNKPRRDIKQQQLLLQKQQFKDMARQSLVLFEDEPKTKKVESRPYDVSAIEKYNRGLQAEIANLHDLLRQCQTKDQSGEIDAMQDALEVSQQEVADLKQALRDAIKRRVEPHHSEEEIVNHCEAKSVLERALGRAAQQLHDLHKEIQSLYKDKGASEMQIQNLTRALSAAEDEVRRSKLALPNLQELRRSIVSEYCTRCCRLEADLVRAREGPCHCCQSASKQKDKQTNQKMDADAEAEGLKLQITNQQITICNLQQALLTTKQQLEELQGKSLDVSGGTSGAWTWPKNGHVSKHSVHDV